MTQSIPPSSQMYRFLRNVNNDLVGRFTDFWHNAFKGKNEPRVKAGGIMTMTLGRDGSVLASQIKTPSSNAKADAFAIKFMEECTASKRLFDALPSCYDRESIEIEFAYAKAAVIWINPSPVYYERDWAYLDKRWEEQLTNDASDLSDEQRKALDALLKQREHLAQQAKESEEKHKLDAKKRQEQAEQRELELERAGEIAREQVVAMLVDVRELVFSNSLGCSDEITAEIEERFTAAGIKVIPNKSLPVGAYFLSFRIKKYSTTQNDVLLVTDLRQLSKPCNSVKNTTTPWKGSSRFIRYQCVIKLPTSLSEKNAASLAAIDEFTNAVKDARAGIPPKLTCMTGTSTE